jgi:hypothetical protein
MREELYAPHPEYSRALTIYPFADSNRSEITVRQRQDSGKWKSAQINWPGIGSQNADIAAQFAAALVRAVEVAREWDKEKGVEK